MIRRGDWKLIETFDPQGVELYNLKDDLGEQNNLASSNGKQRDSLLEELEAWRLSVKAERMTPNPDAAPTKSAR